MLAHVLMFAFKLQVGNQVRQSEDVYEKFWLFSSVHDALDASEAHEIIVDVVKVAMPEDGEVMPEGFHR